MTITPGLQIHQPVFGRNGKSKNDFEVVAHRGARIVDNPDDIAPQNTQPCFQEAAKRGASIELDVIATLDGYLPVHHDDETGKIYTLPTGDKFVQAARYSEIQQARLNVEGHEQDVKKMLGPGSTYRMNPKYLNTPISTLEEVVDALPDTYFYIELKTTNKDVKDGRNNNLEELVAKLIKEKNLYDRVTVISFSYESIRKMKRLDPKIKTGLDFKLPEALKKHGGILTGLFVKALKVILKVDSIHPSYNATTPRLVQAAHRQNLRVVPWVNGQTVEQERQWFHTLREMGVDGLMTNAVDVIQGLLRGTDSSQPASPDIKEVGSKA